MNVVNDWPPNIEAIRAKLDISEEQPVFTYGDTLYNPYKHRIDPALMAHEATHKRQQIAAGGPETWWERYLSDPEFRAEQELAAYRNHFKQLKKLVRDRNLLAMALKVWAQTLSGPMYGSCVPYAVALVRIKG